MEDTPVQCLQTVNKQPGSGLRHLKCSLQNAERGLVPQTQDTSVCLIYKTHTHTHSSPVLLTMGYDDRGLWVTLTHCRPPPCCTPESNTGVFVLAPPSVTIHHKLTWQQPCAKPPLCTLPQPQTPEPKAQDRTTSHQLVPPDRCLASSPRGFLCLHQQVISSDIERETFTHHWQAKDSKENIILVLIVNVTILLIP